MAQKRIIADRLSDLRRIDPHNSALSNGYRDDALITPTFVYPIRRTIKEAGIYTNWGPTPHIPIAKFNQAMGTKRLRIDIANGGGKYAIAYYEVEVPIYKRELDNVHDDNLSTYVEKKTLRGQKVVQLGMAVETASILQNPAKYAAGYVEALTGTSQWKDPASSPIDKIRAYVRKLRNTVGHSTPIGIWFGTRPYEAFTDHADVRERVKYTGDDADEAFIKKTFRVDAAGVLPGTYGVTVDEANPSASVMAELWGDVVLIAPVAPKDEDPDFPLPGAIVRQGDVEVEEYDDPTVQGGPANVKVTKDAWGITQIADNRAVLLLDASGLALT